MIKIGCHVNMSGNDMFLGSVREALSYDANAFMIYTGAPQNSRRKPLEQMKIQEAHDLLQTHDIPLQNIIVHAPYIMNLANPDPSKSQFAIDFLTSEIIRTHGLGIKQIVLHPGAHVGTGEKEAIHAIITGLSKVIENTRDLDVLIALETMAGKGTEVGKTFEEIAQIIAGVKHNERLSVCFDTCHTHDYGYPIKENFEHVLNDFDKTIGKERISVFHINDSKNPSGARKDRHQNIGFGYIGFDALNEIVHHKDFTGIPKILETPYITVNEKKSLPPYLEEIRNFRNKTHEKNGILTYL